MNRKIAVAAILIPTLVVAAATWQTIARLPGGSASAAPSRAAAHDQVQMRMSMPMRAPVSTGAATRVRVGAKVKPMSMAPAANRRVPYGTASLAYKLDHGVKVFHLVARRAKWRVDAHTVINAWTYNGQVPGPVLRFRQGDRVRIIVTNELPEATAAHWHGLDVPNAMDGVPGVTMKPIAPGKSFVYAFTVTSAPGLYIYHPHYDTLKQEGLGMYGALIVDPRTGPAPGVHEMIQVLSSFQGSYLINGKSFPATDAYNFSAGSKVLIGTISADVDMNHPMHLHGFSFREVGINGGAVPGRLQYPMYEQDVAPGETFDMLFTANHRGVWLYHCHNLTHVTDADGQDTGMITVLKVT